MRYAQLNIAASIINIDFALGYRTPQDLEAQALYATIRNDHLYKVERALDLYGVSRKLKELEDRALRSEASVELSQDGFVEMKDGENKVTFKTRAFDLYLSHYFGLSPRHKNYQLIRFYLSFSPFFELLVFNDGLDRLAAKQNH